MVKSNQIYPLAKIALILGFVVVMLGAFTRLTDAGLGCPDWPGCYGHLMPVTDVEPTKAWTEMIHRYAAGTLATLIIFFGIFAFKYRGLRLIPIIMFICVIFQALLGMWTVTLKLLPVVVMGHLLGGMLLLSLLTYWCWQLRDSVSVKPREQDLASNSLRIMIFVGIILVFSQIALGGWVSSNYAGIACRGFPKCNGYWIPPLHWEVASFQWAHRIGAWVNLFYISSLMLVIYLRAPKSSMTKIALLIIFMLLFQFFLGILNVIYLLPLGVAVLHNGIAAALLTGMVSLWYCARH